MVHRCRAERVRNTGPGATESSPNSDHNDGPRSMMVRIGNDTDDGVGGPRGLDTDLRWSPRVWTVAISSAIDDRMLSSRPSTAVSSVAPFVRCITFATMLMI